MGLTVAGFKPKENNLLNRVIPTEQEKIFVNNYCVVMYMIRVPPCLAVWRACQVYSAMHTTSGMIMQMLMNGGTINGKRFIRKETVELFTAYHSDISRRGYGFDNGKRQW